MKKYIALVRQHDETDCGAACLAMILRNFGRKVPHAVLCDDIKVDQYGANLYGLLEGANKHGLHAEAHEGSAKEFIDAVNKAEISLPAVVRIVNRFNYEHFIVVSAIRNGKIYCCDPGAGYIKFSFDNFAACFLGQVVTFEKTEKFVKEDYCKGSIMKFAKLALNQKKIIIITGIMSLIITGIGLSGSYAFKFLVDGIFGDESIFHCIDEGIEAFAVLLLAVFLLYIIRLIVQILRGKLVTFMTKRINFPLMLGYYEHLVDLPMNFFSSHKTGDILSRFSDANKIQEALSNVMLSFTIDFIMVAFAGVTLYEISVPMFVVALIIILLYVFVSGLYIRPLEIRNRQMMEESGMLHSYMKESVDGIQTIKAFHAEAHTKARTRELFTVFQEHGVKAAMLSLSKESIIEFFTAVGTLVLLWIGAIQIIRGEISLGSFVTFHALLGYFFTPIKNLTELQSTLQSAVVAAGRLNDILDREVEKFVEQDKCECKSGDIRMKNIDFRYGNRQLVLKDLSLEVRKGQRVALVGSSGCGKTTITKLLMGFYNPEKGSISIGGQDICNISLDSLRKKVAYVPQETFLFSASLRDNLTLGCEREIADNEIMDMLKLCGCSFVEKMPFGLDSMLEENGMNLSGGERQRLAIVRALLRNPQILILDEASSNLDSIAENNLQSTLKEVDKDMTVIMVAHRLNTITSCDKIFVLDNGSLVEEGTHKELLECDGLYKELWERQMM